MATNKIYQTLIEQLQKDDRLVVDAKLAKNKVIELALQLDSDLIKLLRSSKDIEKTFFQKVDDVLVFDKVKFQSFVSNKQFLPDSFTEYKNKIGLISDGKYLTESNEVVLAFPYKDCVLEGGQTKDDVKRNEVFWNETLAPDEIDKLLEPKVLSNVKRFDGNGEHSVAEISNKDNLIIKGNNLLSLHSLKEVYKNKVKLVYIDPPFYFSDGKQGDSFAYNSSFKLSTWLTFLKNRLSVAHSFLKEDGSIFVQIDDEGYPYLRLILDEIFGKENYINTIHVKTLDPSGFRSTSDGLFKSTNQILFYGKSKQKVLADLKKIYIEKSYDAMYSMYLLNRNEEYSKWKWKSIKDYLAENVFSTTTKELVAQIGKAEFENKIAEFAIENAHSVFRTAAISGGALAKRKKTVEKSKRNKGEVFVHPNEDVDNFFILNGEQIVFYEGRIVEIDGYKLPGELVTDLWIDIPYNGISNEGGVTLVGGKKPEKLLQRIIEMTTSPSDIVLDFFGGSGTTGAVAHKLNRQYILMEQMDYIHDLPEQRLKNVISGDQTGISKSIGWYGGGSFVYAELSQINQLFVDKVQAASNTKELLKVWDEMKETAFLSYKVKPEEIDSSKKEFEALSFEDQQRFLVSILDKNFLYVPYSEIDDKAYSISKEDKELNKKFYGDK